MQKSMRIVMAVAVLGILAACAKKEAEVVYVDEPTVTVEPTYTGKYK